MEAAHWSACGTQRPRSQAACSTVDALLTWRVAATVLCRPHQQAGVTPGDLCGTGRGAPPAPVIGHLPAAGIVCRARLRRRGRLLRGGARRHGAGMAQPRRRQEVICGFMRCKSSKSCSIAARSPPSSDRACGDICSKDGSGRAAGQQNRVQGMSTPTPMHARMQQQWIFAMAL
jgi:hypothetical protein